ncbi:hypothetical protein PHLCEN_2v6228 [Hermanssonia centrifuga]|uniref:Uncharacterized protein n=1 Tax=Hermanssonia centrifuga TaxID=98765 RepID=A0A2R6P019_9APHY|nr:hypothetical protein PHLCEN_2v6228 [Hermanssonia centrifuga]
MATMSGNVQAIHNQIRKLERKKLRVKKEPPIPTIGGGSSSRTVIDLTLD